MVALAIRDNRASRMRAARAASRPLFLQDAASSNVILRVVPKDLRGATARHAERSPFLQDAASSNVILRVVPKDLRGATARHAERSP